MARLSRSPQVPRELPNAWRDLLSSMTSRDPTTRLSASKVTDRLVAIAAGDGEDGTQALAMPVAEPTTVAMPTATAVMPRAEPLPVSPVADAVVRPTKSRRGARIAVILLSLVLVAVVAVAVVLVTRNNSSGGGHCKTHGNSLPGRLEADMQQVERLACR